MAVDNLDTCWIVHVSLVAVALDEVLLLKRALKVEALKVLTVFAPHCANLL